MAARSWGVADACWVIPGARPNPIGDQRIKEDQEDQMIGLDKQGRVFSWNAPLVILANHIPRRAPLQRIMDKIKDQQLEEPRLMYG